MKRMLSLGLLMALLIGTASAALFESGTKDAQPMVLYGKYNNTIVPIKVSSDGTVGSGSGGGSDVIIYASQAGCALDSNITTGGGTDDTACLQTQLNTLATAGGGELVIDGVALISNSQVSATVSDPIVAADQTTCLKMGSGTTIRVIKGGGVFLAASSNCTMIGNLITGDTAATPQTNMAIIGGTWNGNEANQGQASGFPRDKNDATNYIAVGFWFGGFNGVTIRDLTIKNSSTYSMLFTQGSNLVVENVISDWDRAATPGLHFDGMHFEGTMDKVTVRNFTSNGNDDVIALNTDEGFLDYTNYAGKFGAGRLPRTALTGAQSNMYFENIYFKNSRNGIRFYGGGTGVHTLDNIFFKNIYGNITGFRMFDTVATFGKITIDGWFVTGYSGITIGNASDTNANITLRNLVFDTYDNSLGEPIYIKGPNKITTIDGVIANATTNTGTSNWLIYADSATNTNLSISNISTDFINYTLHGATTNVALSNITQSNGVTPIDPALATFTRVTGDYNINTNNAANTLPTAKIWYLGLTDTLSSAITNAAAGDTIVLGSGSYSFTTITIDKALKFIGQGQGKTTLASSSTTGIAITVTASNVSFSDLSITQTATTQNAAPIYLNGTAGTVLSGIRFKNVDVTQTNSDNNGSNIVSGFQTNDAGFTMENCVITTTGTGVASVNGMRLVSSSTAEAIVTNNIYNSVINGISTVGSGTPTVAGVIVVDNTSPSNIITNVYNSIVMATEAVAGATTYAMEAITGADAKINSYRNLLNGTDGALLQANSAVVTSYDDSFIVNVVSGTITYAGTFRPSAINANASITSAATTNIGWSIVAGANTACNTTCTFACVMGFASAATGSDPVLCTDATADNCLCAGAN